MIKEYKAAEQILVAAALGTAAFKDGVKCAPCLDEKLMDMLAGRRIGETPEGEASSVQLMAVWSENWHLSNLAKFGWAERDTP